MKKKEELNLTGNLTLEDIEKIRRDNDKKIKNMSFEELNKHFANAEKDFYKDVEKYEEKLKKEDKNSEIVSDEIILYYKSISKDNYIELINSDLKKVIEFRKSL